VLQARCAVICGPVYGWSTTNIHDIMTTCIILHNMIVDDEVPVAVHATFDNTSEFVDPTHGSLEESSRFILKQHEKLKDPRKYQQLQRDLIEHHWARLSAGIH
jgi:hypothetical protein